jgi:arginine exporter protein ArgO
VTPDEFKGYGGVFTNAEKLQLAATSLAFAGAMQLIGAGVRQAKSALDDRAKRKAKEEVQSELEEFYRLHPEARPPATPLTPAVPVP